MAHLHLTTSSSPLHDMWTTAEQRLLLCACLQEKPEALRSYEAWRARVKIKELDNSSLRLLPLLYTRLGTFDVDDPVVDTCRHFYNDICQRNESLLQHAAVALGQLHECGFETLLLKGAALVAATVEDQGVRPMGDVDILVPTAQAPEAFDALLDLGWKPFAQGLRPHGRSLIRSANFTDGKGHSVDLHWHVFAECLSAEADVDLWRAARSAEISGVPTLVLSSADNLLHVIANGRINGLHWNRKPNLHWIADAWHIIHRHGRELDWHRLAHQAGQRHLSLTIQQALTFLYCRLGAPIPEVGFREVACLRPSPTERREHWLRQRDREIWGTDLALFWYRYRRLCAGERRMANPWEFACCLGDMRGAQGPAEIFMMFQRLLWRRIKATGEEAESHLPSRLRRNQGFHGRRSDEQKGHARRKRVFGQIYQTWHWGIGESRSGPGSSLEATSTLRNVLPQIIETLEARTLLDAGCGDLHWLGELLTSVDLDRYIGVDIVEALIAENKSRYGSPRCIFACRDIVRDPLDRVDVILCRDCLAHLSIEDIEAALLNFRRSGSTYLLATSYESVQHNLADMKTGDFRPINLQAAPFELPVPMMSVTELSAEESMARYGKSLCLWLVADLGDCLNGTSALANGR